MARRAGGRKKTGARRKTSRPRRPKAGQRPWLRAGVLASLTVAFVGGWLASGWVVSLDRVVRQRFDGQRFRVPSRVYSAPTIIYPGLDWQLIDLEGTLRRLGYRRVESSEGLEPGRYVWGASRVRIHVKAFAHPSRPEPDRDVVLRLSGNEIEEIRQLPGGREIWALPLAPEQIGAYYGPSREQRDLVMLDELPAHVIDAVLAVEDQRFETHAGLDPRRIAGALLANLRAGAVTQGGSTLTQQLVKNFFLTPERTYRRKAQEAVMALLVELRYGKDEILQAYLNEIYLGQRGATAVHGIGEAARVFYGKSARELSLAEAALVAAVIRSPNGLSPYREAERAVGRRNLVLDLMHRQGRVDEAAWQRARDEPLRLANVTPDAGDARYFLDLLRRQLSTAYSDDVLTGEGLRIYSTLDARAQRLAARALGEGLAALERRHPALAGDDPARSLQGCIVAMRPQTGEILALVGGRAYGQSQFDRCTQARRQTGSVFKPFVYVAALEPHGGGPPLLTLASFLDDTALEVETPSGPWRPRNFDREFHGRVPVREAIERSFNVATARLAQQVGIPRVIEVARRLGVTSPLPEVASLPLGTAEVSPMEITRAYATLATGGVRPEVQAIEDLVAPGGETLARRRLRFARVLDAGTAFLTTSLLRGVAERGTAAGLRSHGLRGPLAAKTGTTDAEHDLWLVGFTPELAVTVWIGFDEPRSIGIPSSVGALPIWRRFVTEFSGGEIRGSFPRPPEVQVADIEPSTGWLALTGCPERRPEFFLAGTVPRVSCPTGSLARSPGDESPNVRRRFFQWLRRQM